MLIRLFFNNFNIKIVKIQKFMVVSGVTLA